MKRWLVACAMFSLAAVSFVFFSSAGKAPNVWASAEALILKDINPGAGNSNPGPSSIRSPTFGAYQAYIINNGVMYFGANDGTSGIELWKSDGTESGTVMVKDINPGAGNSNASGFNVYNGTLYFYANDGVHGGEIWKSDGTESGTVMVKDINPGAGNSNPSYFVGYNDEIYFSADDGVHGGELWKTDGSGPGTLRVKEPDPGDGPLGVRQIVAANGRVYFFTPTRLWTSDGTSAGTYPVGTASAQSGFPSGIGVLGSSVFFSGWDSTHGLELWISDGTDQGTTLFVDGGMCLYPGFADNG